MGQFVYKYEIEGEKIGKSPCEEGVGRSPGAWVRFLVTEGSIEVHWDNTLSEGCSH